MQLMIVRRLHEILDDDAVRLIGAYGLAVV
jgi:hypothetical protein